MKTKKTFSEFLDIKSKNDKSLTDNYTPPKYLVEPQKDDKGFALVKAAFDSKKSFKYVPGITF